MRIRHRSIEHLQKSTAWRRGIDLVLEIYRVTHPFPREEQFNLTFQLRKAAVRIPSCIAEGRERDSIADRRHFLTTARSSLTEINTQLVIATLLGYLSEGDLESALEITDHLSAMLTKLRRNIKPRPS